MRFIPVVLIMFAIACNRVNSQPSDDLSKDEEFYKALNESRAASAQTQALQQAADQKTDEIITKTGQTIVALKQEVKQLKKELHEANQKLDSIAASSETRYDLRPISSNQENR